MSAHTGNCSVQVVVLGATSLVDLLCFFCPVFAMPCMCLFMCALW